MSWVTFSLGGVSPHEQALWSFDVQFSDETDAADFRRTATGTTKGRLHWRKRTITLSGTGKAPLYLPGVDFSGALTLTIRSVDGVDGDGFPTWADTNFTVLARPPQITHGLTSGEFPWTLECEEVNATVLHSLPFTFSLGGQTPHALAQLDFQQQIEPLVGGNVVRMGSGTGEKREHWRKNRISLSGGGWVPLNGLDALTYSGPLTLSISRLNAIDGDGNPTYTTTNYSVLTDGPVHDWDMVNRLYTWSLDCEEA